MKVMNALLFLMIGDVMFFLPALLPAWFPPNALVGSNTSELWLEVMGVVNNIVGVGLITRLAFTTVINLFAPRPAEDPVATPVPVELLRPALGGYTNPAIEAAERRLAA